MVAPASAHTETKKSNKINTPAAKLKMEATTSFEDLFRDVPSATHPVNLDPQTLLDEWLANDLQQTGFLSEGDDASAFPSPDLSVVGDKFPTSPPLTDANSSPILEFSADQSLFGSPLFEDLASSSVLSSPAFSAAPSPMTTPATTLDRSPVLENMMNLFPELDGVQSAQGFPIPASPAPLSSSYTIAWSGERAPSMPVQQAVPVTPACSRPTTPAAPKKSGKRTAESEISPMDEISIKRQKNTDAARRSRLKKVMKMESLEQRVSSLESENSKLVLKVAVLESEKSGLESKEQDYEKRIKKLEQQLADAHKALTSRIIGNSV